MSQQITRNNKNSAIYKYDEMDMDLTYKQKKMIPLKIKNVLKIYPKNELGSVSILDDSASRVLNTLSAFPSFVSGTSFQNNSTSMLSSGNNTFSRKFTGSFSDKSLGFSEPFSSTYISTGFSSISPGFSGPFSGTYTNTYPGTSSEFKFESSLLSTSSILTSGFGSFSSLDSESKISYGHDYDHDHDYESNILHNYQIIKQNYMTDIEKGDIRAVSFLGESFKQNHDYNGLCDIWKKIENDYQVKEFRTITESIFNVKLDKILSLKNKNMFGEFIETYNNYMLTIDNQTSKFVEDLANEIYSKSICKNKNKNASKLRLATVLLQIVYNN